MMNKKPMNTSESGKTDDVLPEYDFSRGVRGKHSHIFREGYSVTIYHADGSTTSGEVEPVDGMIKIDPDVLEYFPDATAVNTALRGLIALIPHHKQPA